MKFFKLFFIFFCFLTIKPYANQSGITYHGRLIDPNGNPVEGASVQFKMQIRTPGAENCLLYEEVQVKDLSQSDGIFSVTINDGTGTRLDASGFGIDQIFANRGSFNFSAGYCVSGSNYSPNSSDGRKIQVFFNDGSFPTGQWEPTPTMAINFIPMAIESQQIGGYKKEQLLKLADGVSTTGSELDASKWTNLLALINGTSTAYTKPSDQITQLYGATVPTPANGQSIRWNSTLNSGSGGWENFTAGSSVAVTNVTAGTGLNVGAGPGGSITSTGTLNIDVGTTTGKILQVAASNKLPVIDGSQLTNINAVNLGGSAIAIASLTNSQILKYNGTQWVNAADSDTLGGLSCANGRVAYYSGSAWSCLEVTSVNTVNTIASRDGSGKSNFGTVNTGTLQVNDGVSGVISLSTPVTVTSYSMKLPTGVGTSGYALTTDGNSPAQLSWSPMTSSQWITSGSNIYYNTGSIGIGTTSPGTTLDINGTLTQRGIAAPAISNSGEGRIYFDSTSNKFRISQNAGAYSDVLTSATSFINGGNSFGSNSTLGTSDNFNLSLKTNNTTRLTIANSGAISTSMASFTANNNDFLSTQTFAAKAAHSIYNGAGGTSYYGSYSSVDMLQSTSLGNVSAGYFLATRSNGPTGSATNLNGVMSFASDSGGSSSNPIPSVNGVYSRSSVNNSVGSPQLTAFFGELNSGGASSGPITNSIGLDIINTKDTNTLTNYYGTKIENMANPGGAFTNFYGLYVGTVAASNRYALYSIDPSTNVYVAGNVGVGTTNPQDKLSVNGNIQVAKNSAQPYACDAAHDAVITLTSQYTTCVCKGGSASWVRTTDGSTACTW